MQKSQFLIRLFFMGILLTFSTKNQAEKIVKGFSIDKLEEAKEWAQDSTLTASAIVMVDGEIIFSWGDIDVKYLTHSARKSFMSALYGKYVLDGTIDLDATMSDLGIDDKPPLTEQEKTATVEQCLQACSGVFHTAEAETKGMHDLKPDRDQYLPGEYWLYNNWDFNVLRTIFEQETGIDFYVALKKDILDPIGASFELTDAYDWEPTRSIHQAYMFKISARDMALFGQLFLQKGNWEGKQIIAKEWVELTTSYYRDAANYHGDGYGYMWWVASNKNEYSYLPNCELPSGTYSARGTGGQWIEVIPEYNMVFVNRGDTWNKQYVNPADVGKILQRILEARVE